MEHFYGVIMAGGGGTRLWPLSRSGRPKQALKLFDERSLFQIAVDRVLPLIPAHRLRIITIERQMELLQQQEPQLPAECWLREPAPKGTASAVGLVATMLQKQDPQAVMAVLTADHHIADEQRFRDLLAAAHDVAQRGHLVTLGVEPTEPSTGYGYLERGERLELAGEFEVFRVRSFREKPDQVTADTYFVSGKHSWNSGMFVWRCDRILQEIAVHMPALARALGEIEEAIGTQAEQQVLERQWSGLESETIDYGVMEKAGDVVLLPAEGLGWWDVGSWDRLFQLLEADDNGNILLGEHVLALDSRDTLAVRDDDSERLIALLGVKDLVVVDTGKALLVMPRERAEEVRSLVKALREDGLDRYL